MTVHPDPSTADTRFVEAARLLDGFAQLDAPMGALTTYKVGGKAAVMVRPRSLDELRRVGEVIQTLDLAAMVIGRGSNMLVADAGFAGLAISLAELANDHEINGDRVSAGAMVSLPQLARTVVGAGLTGFEWAVGVPGSIGGAVRMNAGGHGSDMQASLIDVLILDLKSGASARVPSDRLGLRFRGSDLADHQVVVDARLQLRAGDRTQSAILLDEIVKWRREHQPGGRNAGSVFVNPIPGKLSAGELVDRVGLRGARLGSASVSSKHANFIQGSDGGHASDVLALIEVVRAEVAAQTGFVLRSEVRLVGFADVDTEGVDVPAGVEVLT